MSPTDDDSDDDSDDSPPLPFPESHCHRCAARRYVRTKTSTFLMCSALPQKYPRQPVVGCPAFREQDGESEPQPDGDGQD